MKHQSVLLNEVITNLKIKENGIYVDATLGYAGHSQEILKRITSGHLYGFDQDPIALIEANKTLSAISDKFTIIDSNFVDIKEQLAKHNVEKIDGIIFDLGLSSPQIDDALRGFSFMQEATLDMRMNQRQKLDAQIIVNQYSLEELVNLFYVYAEEKMAKVIAKKIIEARSKKAIITTTELVNIIEAAVGAKYFNKQHPERQIFQAIRIEVNSELVVLDKILPQVIEMLNPGGRICIITFHSLEDRIVKHIFRKYAEVNELVKGLPTIPQEYRPLLKIINKKPILPLEDEINENSRSKSAKLRIGERI